MSASLSRAAVRKLKAGQLDHDLFVGRVPDALLATPIWQDRFSDDIVITPARWNHIRRDHPGIAVYAYDILRAVSTPKRVTADKSVSTRAVLYADLQDSQEMLVVVERKRKVSNTANQVITAFVIPAQEVERRLTLERLVWVEG